MKKIITTFENVEDGIKTFVTVHELGFSVSLKDTDANEFLGESIVYPNVENAIVKAKAISLGVK